MASVIGVRFRNAGKLYYFDPVELWPTVGEFVIVETVHGVEYGEVVTGVQEVEDDKIVQPLKRVIRLATAEDAAHQQQNEAKEQAALEICKVKVAEHKLPMKLVDCQYTFDNAKILFYFSAEKRVDFRSLVKELGSQFHTRIELRQIGIRDEARMIGGPGQCGRTICCSTFLGDFKQVSIKMAKEQGLSLNPTKISGMCGRLMCCLTYEEENYATTLKKMPKVGKEVITPDGMGTVVELNVLKETVRVRLPKGDSTELVDYPMEEVHRPGTQKNGKNAQKETEPAVAEEEPEIEEEDLDEAEAEIEEELTEEEAEMEEELSQLDDEVYDGEDEE